VSTASNTPQQQAPASLDQVEIFRPGKRRAMNGQVYEITAADVVACAQAYDPALHEAPHVVGHPRTDDPAYGWVAGLQAVDGGASLVITQSSQVEPAFGELVNGVVQVAVVGADGSDMKVLTKDAKMSHEYARWSPDGKSLSYLRTYRGPEKKDIPPALYVSDSDGTNAKELLTHVGGTGEWKPK